MEKFVNRLYELLTLDKPVAATWEEWEDWKTDAKANRPVAYFINETIPELFKNSLKTLYSPYDYCKWWVRSRVFDRHHIVKTGLEPGYWDTDTRMLHGMFNLLVDHVEIEKAWMHVVFDDEASKKYHYPWWSWGYTRFKGFRNPQAGLDHLDWEISLGNPSLPEHERCESQAQYAREIKEIYLWWKNIRPNRPDPHDAGGWSALCDRHRENNTFPFVSKNVDVEQQKEIRSVLDQTRKIEQSYEQEDEQMLIRLIKIRTGLWT